MPDLDRQDWWFLHKLHERASEPECPFCEVEYEHADDFADLLRRHAFYGEVK